MVGQRPHTKSRKGCIQCKTRKVKCDEKRPVCTRCEVRKEKCSFLEGIDPTSSAPVGFKSPVSTITGESTSTNEIDPSRSTSQLLTPPTDSLSSPSSADNSSPRNLSTIVNTSLLGQLDTSQLSDESKEYFQHFINYTAPTLTYSPAAQDLWQRIVPQLAVTQQYLMHVVLEIAACHKSYLSCLSNEMQIAAHHLKRAGQNQQKGIELYIPALSSSTPETCPELLMFNTILSAMCYGWQATLARLPNRASVHEHELWWDSDASDDDTESRTDHDRHHRPRPVVDDNNLSLHSTSSKKLRPVYYISEFQRGLEVWRGTEAIVQQYWMTISSGPLSCIFVAPEWEKMRDIPNGAKRSLDILQRWIGRLTERGADGKQELLQRAQMYESNIDRLYLFAKVAFDDGHPDKSYIGQWPASLSREFQTRMCKLDRIALGMLAFWGACLEMFGKDRWWADGYAIGIVKEVQELINDTKEGQEMMEWPEETVGLR